MSPEEIAAGVAKHLANIARIRAEKDGLIGIERAQIEYYRGFCSHPRRHATSCMGDSGWHCPDCKDGG